MTIDEAITQAREVADCCKSEISTFSNPEPYEIYCNGKLEKRAEEHAQLAEWLEELKTLRYCKDKWNENQYQQGRADTLEICRVLFCKYAKGRDLGEIDRLLKDIEELKENKK